MTSFRDGSKPLVFPGPSVTTRGLDEPTETSRQTRLRVMWNVIFSTGVLIVLFGLDVRDIYYKTRWIGPYDSFPVSMISIDPFQDKAMVLAPERNELSGTYGSGWGSYLESCQELRAVSGGNFFLQVLGVNCSFGFKTSPNSHHAEYLFLASSARVDAVAWATCRLLYPNRRPPLCQSTLVTQFLRRYNMAPPVVPSSWVSPPNSSGEEELLSVLDVIGNSPTIERVTCTGGFPFDYLYNPVGAYNFTVFGCASADHHQSALAGHFAPSLYNLLYDKFWLTVDDLNLLGFHYGIRQNNRALGTITQSDPRDRTSLRLIHRTYCNFSSFGALYVLAISIDVVLMVLHLLTAIELAVLLILPVYKQTATRQEMELFAGEDYSNFFSRSLDRSKPVVLLTIISELLSWMIILPNSVIWTWGLDNNSKFQALLSTMRLWILLLLAINLIWDAVTYLSEARAYAFARRTYLTPLELIAVALAICYSKRQMLFNIGGTKYVLEHQRLADLETFVNPVDGSMMIAYGNAMSEQMDSLISTSTEVLGILYLPLFRILGWSLLTIAGYAVVKLVFFHFYHFRRAAMRIQHQASALVAAPPPPTLSSDACKDLSRFNSVTKDRPPRSRNSSFVGIMETVRGPRIHNTFVIQNAQIIQGGKYTRLPIETVLDTPIRARSLIRDSIEMETFVDGQMQLRPPLYFDFGVFVHHGFVRSRVGFFGAAKARVKLEQYRK